MRTVDFVKCPKCGKSYMPSFSNYWLSNLFGEYPSKSINHTCESCGCIFSVSANKQVVFNTKILKGGAKNV